MPDLSLFIPSVRCIAAIRNRLEYFTARPNDGSPARLLDGLRFERTTTLKEEGQDGLPYVQLYDVLSEESYLVTGARAGGPRGTPGASELYACRLLIVVEAEAGFVRSDPSDATQKLGLLEWVAKVKDAIETDEDDGVPDARLCGSLVKPPMWNLVRTDPAQLSLSGFLDAELLTVVHQRGERSAA